jgi:hypothetical protein
MNEDHGYDSQFSPTFASRCPFMLIDSNNFVIVLNDQFRALKQGGEIHPKLLNFLITKG